MVTGISNGQELRTFRDPAGSLLRSGNRIIRVVNEKGRDPLENFLKTGAARRMHERGDLVATSEITVDPATRDLYSLSELLAGERVSLYEHPPVWFPSYAYEWPAEMLHSAAQLTLQLASDSLEEGFGLKDATPFNILFDNGRPVFVDLCSFEQRNPADPIWLAYGQFERMFLLPLLASRFFGMEPASVFAANLDGLDTARLRQWFRFPQSLRPQVVEMVLLPNLMNQIAESKMFRNQARTVAPRLPGENGKAVLSKRFRDLKKKLHSLRPASRDSAWSGYEPASEEVQVKSELTNRVLAKLRPSRVLDVGCNCGTYSRIAAKLGAHVVAVDSDSTVVGRLWNEVSAEKLSILPLVANFARPTPGMGWRNSEYLSFEQRAQGKFDAVLMLAVLHHIVVRDRIPLEQIFETVAMYTRGCLIIEFVANDDPMFRRIAAGRESLFEQHTEQQFLRAASIYFRVVERKPLESGTRCLFVMQRR